MAFKTDVQAGVENRAVMESRGIGPKTDAPALIGMSLRQDIPGELLSSRARFRFSCRDHSVRNGFRGQPKSSERRGVPSCRVSKVDTAHPWKDSFKGGPACQLRTTSRRVEAAPAGGWAPRPLEGQLVVHLRRCRVQSGADAKSAGASGWCGMSEGRSVPARGANGQKEPQLQALTPFARNSDHPAI